MKNSRVFIQNVIDYTLISVLFLFPLTLNISLISFKDTGHPLMAVNFSIADLLIGIIFAIWIIKINIYKEWNNIKYPPISVLLFTFIGLLSVIHAMSIGQWLKEFIQIFEYFILFYLLIINNLFSIELKVIKNSIFILTTIILIDALIQYIVLRNDIYFIRAFFINENVLGTFLCFISPLIYVQLLSSRNAINKIWMIVLLLLISIVLLSGSAIYAIIISLLIISIIYSKKIALIYSTSIILLTIFHGSIMPAKNVIAIKNFNTIYEQGKISDNYYARLAMVSDFNKAVVLKKDFGDKFLQVSNNFFFAEKSKLNVKKGNLYQEFNNKLQIKNRYLEMQAAVIMLSDVTPLGVGLGNFQDNIGMYYKEIPKINTAEPEQHNEYLVLASTTGVLGLTCFLWILISSLTTNWKRYTINKKEVFYLGLLGSLISIMIEGFFSSLLSSSLLVPFIFIISFSLTEHTRAAYKTQ